MNLKSKTSKHLALAWAWLHWLQVPLNHYFHLFLFSFCLCTYSKVNLFSLFLWLRRLNIIIHAIIILKRSLTDLMTEIFLETLEKTQVVVKWCWSVLVCTSQSNWWQRMRLGKASGGEKVTEMLSGLKSLATAKNQVREGDHIYLLKKNKKHTACHTQKMIVSRAQCALLHFRKQNKRSRWLIYINNAVWWKIKSNIDF